MGQVFQENRASPQQYLNGRKKLGQDFESLRTNGEDYRGSIFPDYTISLSLLLCLKYLILDLVLIWAQFLFLV